MNPGIPPNLTIASLDYLWWGVSAGGHHYTGKVIYHPRTGPTVYHELERKLSLREAKELGDTQARLWTGRIGRVTNRFETLATLESAATRWCKANLPSPWLLQEHSDCNPERAISGEGYITDRLPALRQLAALWDEVPNGRRTPEAFRTVFKAWHQLLDPTSVPSQSPQIGLDIPPHL